MNKQPTTAVPLSIGHVVRGLSGFFDPGALERFERAFADAVGCDHAVATGSGTTAFYLLLAAYARLKPDRDEVVLPAYSVPTLIHAVRLAGLKPVYCDVEPGTLNMDPASMEAVMTGRTLALVPFHMFGFPCTLERALALGRERGVFVIEDACQALGAELGGMKVGSIADSGFFSLCKGKIISVFKGGAVTTNDPATAEAVREINKGIPRQGIGFRLLQPPLLAAFSLSMRPWFYGTFYPIVARFKSTTLHESFHPSQFTRYGAAVSKDLLRSLDKWVAERRTVGLAVLDGLAGDDGLILPRIIEGASPSFNHVPIVFREEERLHEAQRILWDHGIDTARMYERPVHHIYRELGYRLDPEPFPGAAFVAPRLITLPSHPYIGPGDVKIMIDAVRASR